MHTLLLSRPASGQRLRSFLSFALGLLLLLGSSAVRAQTTIYALGTLVRSVSPNIFYPPGGNAGEQGLVGFNVSGAPSLQPLRIVGLQSDEKLVGIAIRPSTGQLYGLAQTATDLVELYLLNPNLAEGTVGPQAFQTRAIPVNPGVRTQLTLGGYAERVSFSFNPVADLVRVVSTNDNNYRLDPTTNALVTTGGADGPLAYAAGDPRASTNPRVQTVAYTNATPGSTSTVLYDIDVRNDPRSPAGVLSTQNPNPGTLTTIDSVRLCTSGCFGIDPTATISLDIYSNGTFNKGYLVEVTAPAAAGTTNAGLSSSNLYDFSLPTNATSPKDPGNANPTGNATNKRLLVDANADRPLNLIDFAVAPRPTITSLVPNSTEVRPSGPGLTLTVNGTGFISPATVQFNGSDRATTFVSATQLTAVLTAADLATVGSYNVTVTNPPFPGVPSAPATFRVTPTCAAPTNLAASSITSTSATVSFTGNGSATSYTVTTSPTTTTQTLPATATSVNLAGLAPNTSYTVSITTTCPSGTTSPATLTFMTSPAAATLAVSQGTTSLPSGGPAYNFGNQTLNTSSSPVAFILTNGGTDPLFISSITATGDFAVTGTVPTPVPANGGTATVNITFTPTATGTRTGTLVISSNASNGATYTVNLTGNGQAATPNPLITVSQGGTGIANGGTFGSFPNTQQGSTSAPVVFTISNGSTTDVLTLGAFTFSGPYTLSGAAPTSVGPGSSTNFSVTFAPTTVGANPGTVSIANNSRTNNPFVINFSGQGTSQDLVVSSPQAVQGSYRNVTIQGPNGVATLSGTLTVSGTLAVQTGGSLIQNCQTINGAGNFDLQAGGAIAICDPAGIATTGAVGAVQVTGTRSFSPQASYLYNGTVAQATGPGLPAQVLNLGVLNPASVTLSQAVAVAGVVRLQSGNLNTGGQPLTLLSAATGTALVDNSGGAVVGTATVQRYIDPSLNAGRGYRHYSAPVANSTVADLSTASYTPVVNAQYNSLGSSVTPFPTVFGFEESRITTSGNTPRTVDFDKGYFSPNALGDALEITRGYTVNIPGTEKVDFVGTLNNGPLTTTPALSRGTQTESGWQLRGNPYPSPLDWSKVIAAGRAVNIENALYVFKSTGQYAGSYTSYVNGQTTNTGTNVLPLGQGFFVRVLAGQTTGSIAFANADRLTTPDNTPFQRGTADARPQLTLALGNGTSRTQTVVYFEAGASTSFDRAFDARSLASPSGLLLATETPTAEQLSINGQPLLTGADVLLPLQLAASTAGTYTLAVDNLANLPTGYHAYLRDALTGSFTDLGTTATLGLTLAANAPAGGRYALLFSTQPRVLATAPAALAQLASVYPNPAHGTATLLLPMALRGTAATAVSVVDNLGRTVLTRTLAAGTAETLELPLQGLAAGVYSVQARTAVGLVAKRLVVQ